MSNRHGSRRPVVLIVLDGWGYREAREGNAIALARAPTWRTLWSSRPRALLQASGEAVGLAAGRPGDSQAGYAALGAGRPVTQDAVRVAAAIRDESFYRLSPLVALCENVRRSGGTLHLLGLVGDGGIHGHEDHLRAAIELGGRSGVRRIAIHAVLDGRDTAPRSGEGFVRELSEHVRRATAPTVIASLIGRHYAMDREGRWARTKLAYDAIVRGEGTRVDNAIAGMLSAYARDESDEFISPMVVRGTPRLRDGDALLCVNLRGDRMHQLRRALAGPSFEGFPRGRPPQIELVTLTPCCESSAGASAFPPVMLEGLLPEVVGQHGATQLRVVESERGSHALACFNGGRSTAYEGEERVIVPSPEVATYDLAPEMNAEGVTNVVCGALERGEHLFILCSYANGDAVGHTGVLSAAVAAVEAVDGALAQVVEVAGAVGATVLVTADHGNCELMIDPESGAPHTGHTRCPVPLVVAMGPDALRVRPAGSLADVAPTVLGLLDLEPPAAMTGRDLREHA